MDLDHKRDVIVPYLCVNGAEKAIEFYKAVFGAEEIIRYPGDDGLIGHATLDLHGAILFLSDEAPQINVLSPDSIGGSPVTIHIQVGDVDAVAQIAVKLGANLVREAADQPYGERNCKFIDPFGHSWMVATALKCPS